MVYMAPYIQLTRSYKTQSMPLPNHSKQHWRLQPNRNALQKGRFFQWQRPPPSCFGWLFRREKWSGKTLLFWLPCLGVYPWVLCLLYFFQAQMGSQQQLMAVWPSRSMKINEIYRDKRGENRNTSPKRRTVAVQFECTRLQLSLVWICCLRMYSVEVGSPPNGRLTPSSSPSSAISFSGRWVPWLSCWGYGTTDTEKIEIHNQWSGWTRSRKRMSLAIHYLAM